MINRRSSNNVRTCGKCNKYQPAAEFLDQGGTVCNTCFAPLKKVIALPDGSPITYVSKTGIRDEMEIVKKAVKRGNNIWWVRVRPKGSESEGTLERANYFESI